MKRVSLFVPGRVCLFGEHSDWAGGYRREDDSIEPGYCIAVGTNQGINAIAHDHHPSFIMRSTLPDGTYLDSEIEMNEDALRRAAKAGGFFSYAAGTAYYMITEHKVSGGLIIDNVTNIPVRKGVSSSAAICVLTTRAFNKVYELGLSVRDEMEMAYLGEILTPSECGRMDQACAYGSGVPTFLTFDGDNMDVVTLSPDGETNLVIVDLKKEKNTPKILRDLNTCYPTGWGQIGENVRWALGQGNEYILREARVAIEGGNAEKVGSLMTEAQEQFDKYVIPACSSELSAPELHRVLKYEPIQELVWGGKGVGSQGDGTAQFVAKGKPEQEEVIKKLEELGKECFVLDIKPQSD